MPAPDFNDKDSVIASYRDSSTFYESKTNEPRWDDQGRRDWLQLARYFSGLAGRLQSVPEYDPVAERHRFGARVERAKDIICRISIRQSKRDARRRWAFEMKRWAAYGAAMSIARMMKMIFQGPPQVTLAGAETPPCWRISYFAQSRYRGGTIRVTVDHETAKVLATEIEFDSGGLSGLLDLPTFQLPPAFGDSGEL